MEIVLASASPRRRELIALLRVPFRVEAARRVDEDACGGPPRALVMALAAAKAGEVAAREREAGRSDAFVVGADTVIARDGEVFGKPRDAEDARRMLQRLSGRAHEVFTGVAVAGGGRLVADAAVSRVVFRELDLETIARYVRGGEPFGKAGAYAIQGEGAGLVAGIDGCYYNVVGLPLRLTARLLVAAGASCALLSCDCARHPLVRTARDCAGP